VVATRNLIYESARRIEDIISVIDGVAFQADILALNAAAAAAREIKVLIEDPMSEVGAGTVLVGQAGETMRKVVTGGSA